MAGKTKSREQVFLETLKGLQTLIEMQQRLIYDAIQQLGRGAAARGRASRTPARRRRKPPGDRKRGT